MPLLCKDPQRSPSGQSVCDEHSVEPETTRNKVEEEMRSRCRSVRVAIGGELLSAI